MKAIARLWSAVAGAGGAVGGSAAPTSLLNYSAPVSNDNVTLTFKQSIGANDALRTGAYSKTLTFTLSTTQPGRLRGRRLRPAPRGFRRRTV